MYRCAVARLATSSGSRHAPNFSRAEINPCGSRVNSTAPGNGHPLADFAYHCMYWRLQPEEFRGIGGLDLDALGIPTEEQYVEMYCRRTGRARIEHWDYYLAYNMFRLAGILQGIGTRR